MYETTQGIKFEIIVTQTEIFYRDEVGGALEWHNTNINRLLVDKMVMQITGEDSLYGASVLSVEA